MKAILVTLIALALAGCSSAPPTQVGLSFEEAYGLARNAVHTESELTRAIGRELTTDDVGPHGSTVYHAPLDEDGNDGRATLWTFTFETQGEAGAKFIVIVPGRDPTIYTGTHGAWKPIPLPVKDSTFLAQSQAACGGLGADMHLEYELVEGNDGRTYWSAGYLSGDVWDTIQWDAHSGAILGTPLREASDCMP